MHSYDLILKVFDFPTFQDGAIVGINASTAFILP